MPSDDKFKQDFKHWQKKCDKFEDELTAQAGAQVGNEFAQLMADNPICAFLFSARDLLNQAEEDLALIVQAASQATGKTWQAIDDTQAAIDALGCETGGS